ncbi:cell differentiation family, Rcd1-like-domain-containing protein [Lanmaoa asiatica]|nr:cell differentiation family, Rcd1-like-domain-containing protein [Lanmaoa asiatica]
MESPDVVDTSDVEEREVFALSDNPDHWASESPLTRPRPDVLASPPRITTEKDHPDSLLTPVTHHDRFSDHDGENPSPRKRIKMAHNVGSVSPGSAHSITAEASLLSNGPLRVAPMEQIPPSTSEHSSECMLVGEDEELPLVQFTSRDISPRSDWHSLFSSPSQPSAKHNFTSTISRVRPQSMEPPSTSQPFPHPLSRSHSISTDHYSLLSSPCRRPTTPPQTSSQRSHDRSSSGRRKRHFVASSPLTPVSSPALLAQTPSQSPDPLQLLSARRPQAPHFIASRSNLPPAIPHPVRSPPVEIPEDPQPLGRYSLRRREARQLNPYAYDKLLYRQQLKSHPDAIVKFRSSRHRPGSGGVGEDGTQDEFVFPLDNPDEDADYVDVEDENGRRRRRVQSFNRNNELGEDGQELEARQIDEGWLPEALKGLSSSDEDDNEIRKLARRVRREREKAEAAARAEARRAAAEARQAEIKTKKAAKKRPKPFPVHGDAEHVSTCFPERVPPPEPSPSPSPARSPFRPPALSRVSFHSPTSSSQPLRSPDFSVYMQQEDSYQFDDHDPLFPRHLSPVDYSVTHSVPPSPSGPPTTSGASALPSNTSGIDSESDQPSAFEMSSKDRKRLRALKHMMPAAMITRQLGTAKTAHPPPPRARVAAESSGSEAEEVRVIPGLARVRMGKYRDVEVRGDPESSDMERPTEVYDEEEDAGLGAMEMLSDGQSAVRIRRTRHPSPRFEYEDDVISLSDSSMPGSSSEDSGSGSSDDEKAHQSLFDRPRGPARERSLIDWMLSRTRNSSRPKSKVKQPTGARKSRGSGAPRLNVVTSGARRYGDHHQTLLPFIRANTTSNSTSSTKHSSEHRDRIVQPDQDAVEEGKKRKKKRKRQSRTNQESVYNVHHDATRITSKHREGKSNRGKSTLVIGNDDNEFRQALDPGWKAEVERWNKPVSPARQPAANPATSAPAVPGSRLCRRTSSRPQNEIPLPFYFRRKDEPFASVHHHIVIDMNITPLPSGVKFETSSYIGKGLLHQLISVISGNSEVAQPMSCDMQGFEIGPTTSAAVFSALLGPLCDRLASALRDFRVDDMDTMKEWEFVTRVSSQLLSWLAIHAEDQEFDTLEVALREYSDGLLLVLESLETSVFSLTAYWFIVELSARLATGVKYRRGSVENGLLIQSAKQLIRRLLGVDLQPAFATFRAAEGDVDVTSLPHRAAELWVCLIHLLPSFKISPEAAPGHPLWRLLADLHPESSPTGAEASEDMWRTIFSLCAISQLSVHGLSTSIFRLPAAWELVAAALKKIVLSANPEKERQLPQRALKKRDDYLSCVVSRCFLLWSQWRWRLDDGIVMFKSLQEIFRSRNFANLLNERSAPMGFLENGDLELLSKRDPHDSVFEVFLKMVVQAVYLLNANVELDPKQRSAHVKKLLQMAVPVSPVPFSRSTPPSAHSLSMLVNRFSAMAVAVHLDPTASNVKFRTAQARRCVSFRDADDHSRVACVYGMMNFAMIVRHHKIVGGLEEVLGWLREMADALMDEYKEGEASAVGRKPITTLIQLLIGSVRGVIETQTLDKGRSRAEYPDPALLDGPWVTRVFNPRTDLVTIQQTGVEIRMLVQSFLNARLKALPDVQPPPLPFVHSVESQESQDEYDKLFLNDEELLAALGEATQASTVAGLKAKEDALCKVLDKSITPAVYRLVCKHFGESERAKNDATSARAADEWIDCWVGCANVLVQNNYKDWGLYMKLGQQSWEKIIDDSWRRRVGLRFNLTLLRLDPGAYNKMKDDFIAVLLVATLSCKTTIEHEFLSVVLSLDGLLHPLLRTAPLEPTPGTRRYEVSSADYEVARVQLIETVFANAAGCLRVRVDAESQAYVELVVMMLSTMRDIYQSAEERAGYGEFFRRVLGMVLSHPELVSHPRMSDALSWAVACLGLGFRLSRISFRAAMAGLISPKPLSYLQHTAQFNPYQQQRLAGSALSAYSETPSLGLQPHQQHIIGIHEENKIYALVIDLMDPNTREGALLELSKKREQYDDLALVLWHSFGIMPALLQEIVSVYPLLSPPNLTAHVSNRVCNALALLQCVASHSETRQLFLNAHIPLFLYPFLNTTSKTRPFEYLRLTSLGVIGALVKQNDNNTVIHFLLSTEIIPLCLRIMETGSELSKTVAIFIVQKILLDETGLTYICHTYERFYAVGTVLSNMVNQLVETQAVRLLKHVVRCYLRLSDNMRAREALRACLPEPLRDQTFSVLLKGDMVTKRCLTTLLNNLNEQ